MKNLIVASMVCMALFTSCTDELDQNPITSKELSQFLRTEAEVEEYVNAVYANLQLDGLYGLYMPVLGEIASDNTFDEVPLNDGGVYGELDLFTIIPANGVIAANWKHSYQGIQKTNVVLNRIEAVSFKSDIIKKARTGEMKFIRALLYFNLVRLYGDVPLVTGETTDVNTYFGQGRTASAKVYEQIIQDLNTAVELLPAESSQPGKVVQTAAQALLGKVYLTLNDYSNARTQLQNVIKSGKHLLLPNLADIFSLANENNKEIIFAVQFASGINGNTEGSYMYQQFSPSATVSGAKGHNLPTKSLYNLYTSADKRKNEYVALATSGSPYNNKLKKPTTVITDGGSNIVVLRYPDVLLMLSEAENELGNLAASIDYLNQIRTRAGLNAAAPGSKEELRTAIALERQLELVGEGHRWFDLIRTKRAVEVMNSWFKQNGALTVISEQKMLLPIPVGQINTDPAIKQNPGYN
ncbi:RagB/SusD family nutrient uptake outer membrane protein [Dyadobacter sp. 3J3]|uniref:RagB/SusD family nutrient uptake outer membrane protein n=1 Tax=Dyadobacter sp. 3J3 TaxID=2606600 RepID=UPI00135B8E47|nr:RagB/SusD family nutrient uptake outer membrane protein [Dyadobacter sp. 3J3]